MKRVLLALTFISALTSANCQSSNKNFDLIIVVDEKIAVGAITRMQVKFVSNGNANVIEADYYPGNLSMNADDYAKIISDSTKKIVLKFNYYDYELGKQQVYNYEIEFMKPWFNGSYNILRIYNLNKSRYKGQFDPIEKNKNYTYELESPNTTFLRIRHKNVK